MERLLVVGNLAKDIVEGEEQYGGSAANLALGAKKFGLDVGIMSVLGRDPFSEQYRKFLLDSGIDMSLTPDAIDEIPVCEVVSRENSISGSVWHDNGCHPAMDKMTINIQDLKSFDLTHLVSCPPGLARRIATANVNVSYEPGPMLVENEAYFDQLVAQFSQFVFLNQEEYAVATSYLQGLGTSNEYKRLLALVVTLGNKGVKLFQTDRDQLSETHLPARILTQQIVDPTGAGDNFKAGFLSGFMRGRSIEECVGIGMDMGAACVMQKGGILPDNVVLEIRDRYNL